ncbi:MAG TPA: hypothetical protein VH678_33280 [Xanthobacteraceae bacterium]|jgi:hypothetical protein
MKAIVAAVLLLSTSAASTAAAAIRCQEAAGREQAGHWSWREIDGKRCWFLREGQTMPPKSAFTWASAEPARRAASAVPEKREAGPAIVVVKVTADERSDVQANWLDDAPVELIVGEDLSGPFGVGGSWVVPPYLTAASDPPSLRAPTLPKR